MIVIDSGEPRNASATHMHGYLGHEGLPPAEFLAIARAEVRSYGVEVLSGRVTGASREADGPFRLSLTGGHHVVARRVIAATGLVDELPDIEGVAEHWGRDVIHCPFCHGFEVRDQRIVHIVTHPMGLHPAVLFRQLSDRYTVVHDGIDAASEELAALRSGGVNTVEAVVNRVVADADGVVSGVELANGTTIAAEVVVVGAPFRARAEVFASLGLEPVEHVSGFGTVVGVDALGQTAVTGLYACGNVADPSQQVLHAAADGTRVAAMVAFSLAREDLASAARPLGNAADWEHRYNGEQVWSGNPNGTLVKEITGMTPGRALDVGAGEGGDAVWLAEQGWTVTATDISRRGLGRVEAEAARRGLRYSMPGCRCKCNRSL